MDGIGRTRRVAGLAAGLSAIAVCAHAAEPGLSLVIPVQSREAAVLELARQAGLSVGFTPDARCGGQAGVSGRMSVDAALTRLLAGSACVAVRPDPRTVVIRPRPSAAPPTEAPPRPGPAVDLGELVVTAQKTETLLSATPYGLTAASGADLARRGINDVRDLPLLAAGLTVTNLGPGRDKVLLRGLSDGPITGHTQSTVGLYLGELRLTYNAPDPDLPFVDVARVEVLRGPQGSLYGAGSIGGILQVVPNAPDLARRSGELSVGAADTAHGQPSYDLEAVFNQPLAGGVAAVRAVTWAETTGGVLDNVRLGRRDTDRSRRQGLRLTGLWQATPDLALDLTVIDQTITTRDAHYVAAALGPRARTTAVAEPHDNDFLAVLAGAHWTPSWGRVTASLGALDHDVTTTYDASAAPAELMTPGGRPLTYQDGNEIRGLVSEVRAASTGADRLRWTAGAFNAFGQQKLDAVLTGQAGAAGYVEVRRDRLRESALFGELSYDLTPALTLTAGGRLFSSRLQTRSTVAIGAPIRRFEGVARDTGFAPKLLAAWRPASGLTVYLQAAQGYRTAGFNTSGPEGQTFGDASGDAQPLRRYGGDELWNAEAGMRWRSSDGGLTARAAVFQADWDDIQTDRILPSGLPYTANLGDGRSRGVEIEGSFTRGPWVLAGNLVRQEPELRRPAPGVPGRGDTGLPGVPDLSYAATVLYTAELPRESQLELSASYAYVGHSRLTFDAVTAPTMGGYGDLRLAADLRSGPYRLRLSVENALDRHGDTLAFGNPFTFRTETQTTPQQPRTVAVRIARAF